MLLKVKLEEYNSELVLENYIQLLILFKILLRIRYPLYALVKRREVLFILRSFNKLLCQYFEQVSQVAYCMCYPERLVHLMNITDQLNFDTEKCLQYIENQFSSHV